MNGSTPDTSPELSFKLVTHAFCTLKIRVIVLLKIERFLTFKLVMMISRFQDFKISRFQDFKISFTAEDDDACTHSVVLDDVTQMTRLRVTERYRNKVIRLVFKAGWFVCVCV